MRRLPRIGDLVVDSYMRRQPQRFLVLGLRDDRFPVHALCLSTGKTDWYVLAAIEECELESEID